MKSILTKYDDVCAICGAKATEAHHLIMGTYGREFSERNGLKVPLCSRCHNKGRNIEQIHGSAIAEQLSRICGQLAYEKKKCAEGYSEEEAREEFRREFGKSFL